MSALDDSPHDLCGYEATVCAECGGLAEEELDGLCERCRCVDCGATDAPVQHDGARLCRHCATDRNVYGPLFAEAAE